MVNKLHPPWALNQNTQRASRKENIQIKIRYSKKVFFQSIILFILFEMLTINLSFQNTFIKRTVYGASLVAQWLRICLPMQGTRVRALVWEDPTCRRATGPMHHNY